MPEHDDVIRRITSNRSLPTLPVAAVKVLELSRSDAIAMYELAQVVGSDPVLAARIVRYCNSPVAGLSRQVKSLTHAVVLTGLRRLKTLALGFSLLSIERKSACPSFNYDEFWSKSLARAVAAKSLCKRGALQDPEEAFLAGLLLHIGQLVMAVAVPKEFEQALQNVATQDIPSAVAEETSMGATSSEVGAWILRSWFFPPTVVSAIRRFKQPEKLAGEESNLASTLHMADLIAEALAGNQLTSERLEQLRMEARARHGIRHEHWDRLCEEIGDQWIDYGDVLGIPAGPPKSCSEIESEAREQLTEMSLSAQQRVETQHMFVPNSRSGPDATQRLDALTGIGNRSAFDERLLHEILRCEQFRTPFSLLLLKIEQFDWICRHHGQSAAEELLRELALLLRNSTRQIDFIARLDDCQFAIIAPDCETDEARATGELIRSAVDSSRFSFHGDAITVTMRVGVASTDGNGEPLAPESLVDSAQQQLLTSSETVSA